MPANGHSAHDNALRSRGAVLALRTYTQALKDRRKPEDAFWMAVEEFRNVNSHLSSDEAKTAVFGLIKQYNDAKESL